jgi:hypothetical protein
MGPLPESAGPDRRARQLCATEAYADQNERDYRVLIAAINTGRIAAHEGL